MPGEEIPYTRACTVAWLPDNSGFYYTRYPTPGSVPAGEELYNRHVFFHRLGQDWQTDADVFGQGMAREDWPMVSLSPDGRWLLVEVSQGSSRTEVYVQDRQAAEPAWVPVHTGVEARADGEIVDGVLYLRSNEGASNYQVWAVDPANPARDAWQLLIPEAPDRVLQHVLAIAGRLAVVELRDATSRVVMYDRDGTPQASVELPSLGSVFGLGGTPGRRAAVSRLHVVRPAADGVQRRSARPPDSSSSSGVTCRPGSIRRATRSRRSGTRRRTARASRCSWSTAPD